LSVAAIHHRRVEPHHLAQVERDRLGLPALLGADARVGARRINKAHDGQTELLGRLHQAKRLAETFRMRHPEVAITPLLGVLALLVRHEHQPVVLEPRNAPDQRVVVGKQPVAVQS
jgi:hypothetical protein